MQIDSFIRLEEELSKIVITVKLFDGDLIEISFSPSREPKDKELEKLFNLLALTLNDSMKSEMKKVNQRLVEMGFQFRERIIS